ncbi:MAG: cytochrome P450 [Kamptonema sp. SIO1D9]|nr:cytochrome P450 [Kamptonema sp. SIO1D9]
MKFPEGPRSPELIQTIELITNSLNYLERCNQRYGDIFTIRFLSYPPSVIVSNPQAIEEIFTADPKIFNLEQGNKILPPALLGANSVIFMDGDRHEERRRLLSPPFRGERMRVYGQLIFDITQQIISQWTIGKPFQVRSAMQQISMQTILRAVFGLNEGNRLQQLENLLTSMMNIFSSPWRSSFLFIEALQRDLGPWSLWGNFLRTRKQADELIYEEIHQRRNDPNLSGEDVLSLAIAARDSQGQSMTPIELRDELMTLLVAGHDNVASSLAWALYWIHRLPEVREKLLTEIETLGSHPEPLEVTQLPYLEAVCQETLRICPPVLFTFPRILQAPFSIMGYDLQPGTLISPCIYLTHQRPDLYPEPKSFQPERFLAKKFSPFEFFPFGGGNRRCLGVAFAQFEMKLILAKILSHLQLTSTNLDSIKPQLRGGTLAPSENFYLIPTLK